MNISSSGMGLKDIVLHNHKDRKKQPMKIGLNDKPTYALSQISDPAPLFFNINKIDENIFEGVAFAGQTKITIKSK